MKSIYETIAFGLLKNYLILKTIPNLKNPKKLISIGLISKCPHTVSLSCISVTLMSMMPDFCVCLPVYLFIYLNRFSFHVVLDELFNLSTLIIVLFVTLSSSHDCHLPVIIVIYFMNIWTFPEIKMK